MALNRQAHPDNASAVRASSVSASPCRTWAHPRDPPCRTEESK
jgi:hypothetical protein